MRPHSVCSTQSVLYTRHGVAILAGLMVIPVRRFLHSRTNALYGHSSIEVSPLQDQCTFVCVLQQTASRLVVGCDTFLQLREQR